MDDVFPEEVHVSIEQLLDVGVGFLLCGFLFDLLAKVAIAQFSNNVGIILGVVDLEELEDTGSETQEL